jgi:leader peptidase (prepilin peptidase)/N-methyltransferase
MLLLISMVIFIFIIGLIIGSFLNAIIWRLHSGESIIFGRSMCPQCRKELSPKDLVPLFSFIALSGKCRYCGGKISWQYPTVELSTSLLFVLSFALNYHLSIFNYQLLAFFSRGYGRSIIKFYQGYLSYQFFNDNFCL